MSVGGFKLFALSSNVPLSRKIARHIGVELQPRSVARFSDGEIQIDIGASIRGDDIFLIQSTSAPVNDNLMELLIMVDAMRRASARSINVIMPYYGYARQDRKANPREPITAKLVANMLESAGVNRVITIDLHAAQIQGFFDIPVDHLRGVPVFTGYILENGYDQDAVIVSPDHGGVNRARVLAEYLKAPLAIIDKRRPKPNVSEVMNIIGNVKGKKAIIIDDIIDTAGTLANAADALLNNGAKSVIACCTHAVLSGPAIARIEKSGLEKVVVTDTINVPKEKRIDKLQVVSVGPMMGEAISRAYHGDSLSPLFEIKNRYLYRDQPKPPKSV